MSKRSELRRMQREAEKKAVKQAQQVPVNVLYGSQEQVQKDFGLSVQELKVYLERMERQIKKDFELEYQAKLEESKEYIAMAYTLIAIYAIKMSRKKGEHTKDLVNRFVEHISDATEEFEKIGLEQTIINLKKEFDIDVEFQKGKL